MDKIIYNNLSEFEIICLNFSQLQTGNCERSPTNTRLIRILYNYLSEFERIQTGNCEDQLFIICLNFSQLQTGNCERSPTNTRLIRIIYNYLSEFERISQFLFGQVGPISGLS
jgi:uncharacterized protein YuzB (UPF0349 family)